MISYPQKEISQESLVVHVNVFDIYSSRKIKDFLRRAISSPSIKENINMAPKPKAAPAATKPKVSKFMQPMKVSADLAAVVGKDPLPRTEVTKRLWAYIKENNLQDSVNRRNINPDANLQKVFGGKKAVNMFEMTKLVNKHLS